jgi:hypothetical protein
MRDAGLKGLLHPLFSSVFFDDGNAGAKAQDILDRRDGTNKFVP